MPNRQLKVTHSVSWIAVAGRCSRCDRLFDIPCHSLEAAGKANRKLLADFRDHNCADAANTAAAPVAASAPVGGPAVAAPALMRGKERFSAP